MLRISDIIKESIVDGPGFRYVVFTQGCDRKCPDCHNPQTHDRNGGYDIDINELFNMIKENPLLDGVTFSGGEPFYQPDELAKIGAMCHNIGLNIITYTGYIYEELLTMPETKSLLDQTDILVDGPFLKDEKSIEVKFRGSKNQRMIDIVKSRLAGETVLYEFKKY